MTQTGTAAAGLPAPSDDEVLGVLGGAFSDREVTRVERRPFDRASSFALEELRVVFDDGSSAALVFKDFARQRMLAAAAESKPTFLYEPRRCIETYRRILAPDELGPRCYAAIADPATARHWLFLERIRGSRLGKIADVAIWEAVAAWLGRFHARYVDRVAELRAANPFLLDYEPELYCLWWDRARIALEQSDDPRAGKLLRLLETYEESARALAALPRTFIHGEFVPSNVLIGVTDEGLRVCPVDWEMSATGPGLLDLAALAGGKWDDGQREGFLAAYRAAMVDAGADVSTSDDVRVDFDRCQLHLALQWLGWSVGYNPPPGRRTDWLGEAIGAARRLGARSA